MDAEATAAGKQPASDDVWILSFNGKQVGLLKNGRAWQRVQEQHPGLQLITENDVILALEAMEASTLGKMKQMIQDGFPQAEVTGFKFKKEGLEDAIPF